MSYQTGHDARITVPAPSTDSRRSGQSNADLEELRKEGKKSLKVFMKMCAEDGVNPRRNFTGRFNLRISPDLHERIAALAEASGKSIKAWMIEALDHEVRQESN